MNENEEKIYDLISSKSFAELTEEERALVLGSLGSAELYEKMREANLAAEKALSDDLIPPAEIKASVMAAFDEKDEKRGIIWWKYAAAVAILVVGAFVFWPSGNLEREPIAENAERKDSTEQKKESQHETKKADDIVIENEEPEEKIEPQTETPEAPTITSTESSEVSDEMIVVKIDDIELEDTEEEIEMDFPNESAENYSAPEEDKQPMPTLAQDGASKKTTHEPPLPEISKDSKIVDSSIVRNQDYATPNMNVVAARSAKTSMTHGLTDQDTSFEGITLESIGGSDKKAYVAY
ncbi:hypothetical protein O3Q51_05845 [Cryomorphaceae bacterium 1068]|nr:hypothetical protein [Cryomorphaceae bacterium 1068]